MRTERPPGTVVRSVRVLVALAAATVLAPAVASTQEPADQDRACTLVLEPATDSTRSRTVEVGEEQYVTHVGNGLRWTCGDARMYADSAVKYDRERRFKAIGSVDYRDSVRTLTADTLTYYEREDRLLAEGNAVLTHRGDGSVLSGPRIVFLRAASDSARRTVATDRPHMTVRPESSAEDTTPPVELDADRIVLAGQDEVRSRGEVRIQRPDLDATADSAFFYLDRGEGWLYGSPEVRGESFTLSGRRIRTGFGEGELRDVRAEEEARATGDGFDLHAAVIEAHTAAREIDRMWAYGEGRSVALAPPYRLMADSLAFRFAAGRLDTLTAVKEARAVELVDEAVPDDPFEPIATRVGDRSWVTADTLILAFAGDTAGPEERAAEPAPDSASSAGGAATGPDTAAAVSEPGDGSDPAADEDDLRLRRVRAVGSARAYRVMHSPEEGGSPARHYQKGEVLIIHFEDGEAQRVEGRRAIGIHLDPMPGGAAPESPVDAQVPAVQDTAAPAPEDTINPVRPDTAPPASPDSGAADEAEPPRRAPGARARARPPAGRSP